MISIKEMPYQKKYRPKKKKSFKKTTRYRRRRYRVNRPILSGFPKRKLVKLRYVKDNVSLDPGTGLTASHVFRANSCFDPDFTSVSGGQPMGFDQWSAIYERYVVVGAKMKVMLTPRAINNAGNPAYLGITSGPQTDNIASFTSIANILESKHTRNWRIVNNSNTAMSRYQPLTLTKYFSAKKTFGVKNILDDSDYGAPTGSNPANQHYLQVWSASVSANDPAIIDITVVIDYIVMFQDPKILDGS